MRLDLDATGGTHGPTTPPSCRHRIQLSRSTSRIDIRAALACISPRPTTINERATLNPLAGTCALQLGYPTITVSLNRASSVPASLHRIEHEAAAAQLTVGSLFSIGRSLRVTIGTGRTDSCARIPANSRQPEFTHAQTVRHQVASVRC